MVRPAFRADIEGLRAIAILLVVLYHAEVPGFTGGFIGVDVFFVLSGYLITWLLVREREETGRLGFARFYARRAKRLLPAAFTVFLVSVAAAALLYAPFEQAQLAYTARATAVYLSNLHFARTATDYLAEPPETNPFLHTWSLSVEEQFYVVWPLFLLLAMGITRTGGRGVGRRRLVSWIGAAAVGTFGLGLYWTEARPAWAFFLSPPRAWQFAAGALALLIPTLTAPVRGSGWAGRLNPVAAGGLLRSFGWLGLLAVVAAGVVFDERTRFPGVAAVLPVIGTALALRAGSADGRSLLARALGVQPLQWIGRLSYSWYLWHWPVLVFGAVLLDPLTLVGRMALVALSLVLAVGSYHLVEHPLRHHRLFERSPWPALGMAVIVAGVGLVVALAWRQKAVDWKRLPEQRALAKVRYDVPVIQRNGCNLEPFQDQPVVEGCIAGAPEGATTVVLTGDSHAAHWFPGVDELARRRGWRLVSLTKFGCPILGLPEHGDGTLREYRECDRWRRRALALIGELRPAAVFAPMYSDRAFSETQWEERADAVLTELAPVVGRVFLFRDTPDLGIDATMCLARNAWRPGNWLDQACVAAPQGPAGARHYRGMQRAAARHPNAAVLDVYSLFCSTEPCEIRRGGRIPYRDGHHLAASYARSLGKDLGELVDRAGGLGETP